MIRHLFGTGIKALMLVGWLTCIFSTNLFANSVTASWEANVEPDLKGYKLYYGSESGNYTESIDVGKVTTKEITNLSDGSLYYFAVTAYDSSGNESPKSTEVTTLIGENLITANPGANSDSTGTIWKSVPGANGYQVLKSSNPFTGFTAYQTLGADQTTLKELADAKAAGTGSYYKVKATKNSETLYEFQTVGHYNVALKRSLNLVSLPLIPGDSSVTAVLGTQFRGSNLSALSDKVHIYNPDTGLYETAWFFESTNESDALHHKWVTYSGLEESPLKIRPNEGFWIELNQSRTDTVFTFSGLVCVDTARAIILKQGYNFIGTPFPVEVALDSSGLAEVITGSEIKAGADYLIGWKDNKFEKAWLYDKDGEELDGKFLMESGSGQTDMKFKPGYGYVVWVKNPLLNNIWILPNPGRNISNN